VSARPVHLRIALVFGLCAAVLTYSSGVSAWWSVLAGLIAAGLAYALAALL
jgi:hypothetical protein